MLFDLKLPVGWRIRDRCDPVPGELTEAADTAERPETDVTNPFSAPQQRQPGKVPNDGATAVPPPRM